MLFSGFLADAYADPSHTRPVLAALLALAVAALPALLRRQPSADLTAGNAVRWLTSAAVGSVLVFNGASSGSYGLCLLGVLGVAHLLLLRTPDVLGLEKTFQAGAVIAAAGLLVAQRISLSGSEGTISLFLSNVSCGALAGQKIHIFHLLPFWGLGPLLFALLADRTDLRRAMRFLAAAVILLITRVAFVLSASSLMRDAVVLDCAFVPFLELVAGYALSVCFLRREATEPDGCNQKRSGAVIAILGVILFSALAKFDAPSELPAKRGRVLIDEAHGKWETVDAPYDMDSYGRHTVYNYRLMQEWIGRRFETEVSSLPLTNLTADIVIVKTPVRMFTMAEKDAIRKFVNGGGQLIVIGDHTNLFGTTDVINDLLEWSGLRLNDDAVIAVSERHHDMPRRWWSFSPGLAAVPYIEFQTGASVVSSSVLARPLLIANRTVAEKAEYTNERFFGNLVPSLDDRPGPICMAAERRLGKGAVTLFSDSTIWSNFSFYAVTNEDVFEALIRSEVPRNPFTVALTLLAVLLLTAAARRRELATGELSFISRCITDAAVALSLILLVCGTSVHRRNRLPAEEGRRVVFDAHNSSVQLRADIRTGGWNDLRDYSTFYAWLSRSGLHPRFEPEHAYDKPSLPVLLVDPKPQLGRGEVRIILSYLMSGGRMLILIEPDASGDTPAGDLLHRLGVAVAPARTAGSVCDAMSPGRDMNPLAVPFALLSSGRAMPSDVRMSLGRLEYGLTGVTPLLAADAGMVMAGEVSYGAGRVTVFARSKLFSEYFFGDVWGGVDPSAEKLQAYGFLKDMVDYAFRQ